MKMRKNFCCCFLNYYYYLKSFYNRLLNYLKNFEMVCCMKAKNFVVEVQNISEQNYFVAAELSERCNYYPNYLNFDKMVYSAVANSDFDKHYSAVADCKIVNLNCYLNYSKVTDKNNSIEHSNLNFPDYKIDNRCKK